MTDSIPAGFDKPTQLPRTEVEAARWQEANRVWWENNPMRYDWRETLRSEEFTPAFYREIDERFFASTRTFLPWRHVPFEQLIPYDSLGDKSVLEIGVGNGTHAQLLATHAKSFVGIDLTDYAVRSTSARMDAVGIDNAEIRQMDAEELAFSSESFDFIWSWGVIHHSANTDRILAEMTRVLKPGGTAVTMVYHRSTWVYYILNGFFRGVLKGELLKTRSLSKTTQRATDGAIARHYKPHEWRDLVSPFFEVRSLDVFGAKAALVPLPAGRLKHAILRLVPDSVARFFLSRCRMGMLLVTVLQKR
jgi:ubiquinone/menaquinone biosynthesis C-methylase UbiE